MQTWDAIRARRNVRAFTDAPISSADLDRILEAGRRSPSAGNAQPWDFVVCTDAEQLRELSKVSDSATHVASSAATVVLVSPQTNDPEQRGFMQYDLGQATMLMMLAAADLGIGSGHSAVGEQDLARALLGVPSNYECLYLLAFGYPQDRPIAPLATPKRRSFEQVVHRSTW